MNAPRRRSTPWRRLRAALTAKWELLDAARHYEQRAKLAEQENAFLKEQLAAYRDTCQSLQQLHRVNGAEASVAIEMLKDQRAKTQ